MKLDTNIHKKDIALHYLIQNRRQMISYPHSHKYSMHNNHPTAYPPCILPSTFPDSDIHLTIPVSDNS